jgi:hypothetical protein
MTLIKRMNIGSTNDINCYCDLQHQKFTIKDCSRKINYFHWSNTGSYETDTVALLLFFWSLCLANISEFSQSVMISPQEMRLN